MTSNKVINILMNRDGLTQKEAEHQLKEVRDLIDDAMAAGDYEEVEEIVADELGLEMDYIFDILG